MKRPVWLGMLLPVMTAACGDDDPGQGELQVTTYGEEFVEQGIPASEVSDGWSVTFSRFRVTLRDVRIAGEMLPDADPIEVTQPSNGSGHMVGSVQVPAGSHGDASFTIAALEVAGMATKGDVTKQFDWVFDRPVSYDECETTTEVSADGAGTFQITLHADHLLYDSLVSEEPMLGFQSFADADSDGDGMVEREELELAGIGAFDPGNNDEVDDLWSWLEALVETVGHVDGEGHCHSHSEPDA